MCEHVLTVNQACVFRFTARSAVHWQLGILIFTVFARFSADCRPTLAPKPLKNDGVRPAVPVAAQISPADQF